jgi:DNA-binding NarL/FixJ family response regulator
MKSTGVSILLIAKPGYRRNSISSSLHSIPSVGLLIADGTDSGLQMLTDLYPTIVLIDAASLIGHDYADLCLAIKRTHPGCQCYLLVDNDNPESSIIHPCIDGLIQTNRSAYEFAESIKFLARQSSLTFQEGLSTSV